jgi:hypothetical protein
LVERPATAAVHRRVLRHPDELRARHVYSSIIVATLMVSPDRALHLHVLSYEFPQADSEWDANWLNVRIDVADGSRNWTATAPAFLHHEIVDLVEWLRALADGTLRMFERWGALEPLFEVEAEGAGEAVLLRALFSHEFHPSFLSWYQADGATDEYLDQVLVEFAPGALGLRRFADELEQELERFPRRSARTG